MSDLANQLVQLNKARARIAELEAERDEAQAKYVVDGLNDLVARSEVRERDARIAELEAERDDWRDRWERTQRLVDELTDQRDGA